MKLKKLGILISAVTLTAAAGITVNAKDANDYQDVNADDWFYDYVADVSEKELVTGVNDTTFSPNDNLERGQFATIIYRMHGSPERAYEYCFPDVEDGYFYSIPVTWAACDFGVIRGYDDDTFGPSDKITREQLATMLYRYADRASHKVSPTGDLSAFSDAGNVSSFAQEGMSWAVGEGIITGDNGLLNPHGNVSRAVCATMIARFNEAHHFIGTIIFNLGEETNEVTEYRCPGCDAWHRVTTAYRPGYEFPPHDVHAICQCGYWSYDPYDLARHGAEQAWAGGVGYDCHSVIVRP